MTGLECPKCDRPVNAVISVKKELNPDEGEWCYSDGEMYVHETLYWYAHDE